MSLIYALDLLWFIACVFGGGLFGYRNQSTPYGLVYGPVGGLVLAIIGIVLINILVPPAGRL